MSNESFNTIVIGGGQAGLAAGYYLAQRTESFMILDDRQRTGDVWRNRRDHLQLFTPGQSNHLPGKPFPRSVRDFPFKDEVADYLEQYARQFQLPIRHATRVEELKPGDEGYDVSAGASCFHARNVIVATGPYQSPYIPSFAHQLDPTILQLHSSNYHNPLQIPVSSVLVVGAGNSGAEIALDLSKAGKRVWLAGRDVGKVPIDAPIAKIFGGRLFWFINSQVFSVKTPIGRRMKANRSQRGTPLGRIRRQTLAEAGIELTPRVSGIHAGKPQLEDHRGLPVEAVIWATGFQPDYKWIHLPVFDENGYPRHTRGVVPDAPGLYFLGLQFQTSIRSSLLGGVGTDACYIVKQIFVGTKRD